MSERLILYGLICLAILCHELGHFLVGRLFGCRIKKLCLFYDPGFHLLSTGKRFHTELTIGWIPLGGYVLFQLPDKEEEPNPQWCILAKKSWQRMLISLSGILVNLLLGYGCLLGWNVHYTAEYGINGWEAPWIMTNGMAKDISRNLKENVEAQLLFMSHQAWEEKENPEQEAHTGKSYDWYFPYFQHDVIWQFSYINLSLALLNTFPIPPLDGGNTLLHVFHMLTGKEMNDRLKIILMCLGIFLVLWSLLGGLWLMVQQLF